jgi:hypothetical protein
MSSQQVTISRSRKTAKKTTKKEYYFHPELWRIIMAYVGTPEQYVTRYYSLYTNMLPPVRTEAVGIPITRQQYEDDGFKIQHTNGLFYDIKNEVPATMLQIIRWLVGQNMPGFSRYCRRILKVLVKQNIHPTYVDNTDTSKRPLGTHFHKLCNGGDYIVVFSNKPKTWLFKTS